VRSITRLSMRLSASPSLAYTHTKHIHRHTYTWRRLEVCGAVRVRVDPGVRWVAVWDSVCVRVQV
jgi:hypothetical protein